MTIDVTPTQPPNPLTAQVDAFIDAACAGDPDALSDAVGRLLMFDDGQQHAVYANMAAGGMIALAARTAHRDPQALDTMTQLIETASAVNCEDGAIAGVVMGELADLAWQAAEGDRQAAAELRDAIEGLVAADV